MRMCDTARIKGWWFLPESPDHRVPGILTWSQADGVELEVIGGLKASAQPCPDESIQGGESLFGGDQGEVTIFGETDAGKPVSVWEAERHRYSGDAFGNPGRQLMAGAADCRTSSVELTRSRRWRAEAAQTDAAAQIEQDGRLISGESTH